MRASRTLLVGGLGAGVVAAAIAALPSTDEPAHRRSPDTTARATAGAPPSAPPAPPAPPAPRARATPAAGAPAPDPRERFARALSGHREPVPPRTVVAMIEDGLAATGESAEPWTRDAERTFAALRGELPVLVRDRAQLTSPRCFAAGCMVTIEYPADSDALTLAESLLAGDALAGWPGGKLVAPVVPGTGGAQAQRWVLIRPDHL
jgi:hypothetical protein